MTAISVINKAADTKTVSKEHVLTKALIILALSKKISLEKWLEGKVELKKIFGSKILSQINISPLVWEYANNCPPKERERMLISIQGDKRSIEDIIAALRTEAISGTDQKKSGAVFTPSWIADKVTQNAWQHWNKLHRTGRKVEKISDVSCGTGTFLSTARSTFGIEVVLHGNDVDEISVIFSQILNEALNLKAKIRVSDSLTVLQNTSLFSSEAPHDKFDILIGNPPYVRSQNLDRDYIATLRQIYPDITPGNFDLSVIFIEHAIRSLTEGGIASYITSSKFINSEYGKAICSKLAKEVRILNITDFKDSQIFPDHTTYTLIITFAKLPPAKKFTVTHFPTGVNNSEDFRKAQTFSLNTAVLEKFPWNLSTDQAQSIIVKTNSTEHHPIGHVFPNILQGLRTGKNEIFVIKNDETKELERQFLKPFVGGEEIKRITINKDRYSLLYPYETTYNGKIINVEEESLKRKAPNTYSYLKSNEEILNDRDNDKKGPWYAYSRVQNLHLPQTKKILVKEMMPSSQFAADIDGDVAIGSGYALVNRSMSNNDLLFWSAILSTDVMEFILRHNGTQLHSGWFRLLKHHLESIKLPNFSPIQRRAADKIIQNLYKSPESTKHWEMLDEIVAASFHLTEEEYKFIKEYITSCHKRSLPVKDDEKQVEISRKNNISALTKYTPVDIKKYHQIQEEKYELRRAVTFQLNKQLPVHNWFPFTQGYSEPLVEFLISYLGIDQKNKPVVLDPFVGSGTTVLTCKKHGISSVSFDISPLMTWVSKTKVNADSIKNYDNINYFLDNLKSSRKSNSGKDVFLDFLSKAFSSGIWTQVKNIRDQIVFSKLSELEKDFLTLGLIGMLEDVSQIRKHGSHYRYMLKPDSIGLQKLTTKIMDPGSDIMPLFKNRINKMISDISNHIKIIKSTSRHDIYLGDARDFKLKTNSIDYIITSPPYLNRNNYIAQQKAELSLLNLVKNQTEYKDLVRSTFRSHTDSNLDTENDSILPEVKKIISAMELSEGNNEKIPQMISGYFIDLEKNLDNLYRVMKKGAKAAFIVGNSRWGGVVVPVDHLLLLLAEKKGFKAEKILITRMKGNSPQQMKRFGKVPVRESVVIFQKL